MGAPGRIFISYRRGDVPGDARGVCDRLERKFGEANVFMDVDRLLAGQRFDRELDKALAQCDVLIAVIGPRWMELLSEHVRSGERDFVHDEIAAALKRDIVVIPALIGREGHMPPLPRKNDLPEDIRDLVLYQKHDIVHESFNRDTDHLTAAISSVLYGARRARPWRMIAIPGALALTLVAALLGYWTIVIPSNTSPPGTEVATRNTQSNPDVDRAASKAADEAAKKKAENEEADKKVDGQARLAIATDCDRLAASPFDPNRPSSVAGVDFAKIDTVAATTACDDAIRRYPGVTRFVYQAGRAASAGKNYSRAMELYRAAIAKDNVAAMASLGNLYERGDGVAQDYVEARKWYEKAGAFGNAGAMFNIGKLNENGSGVAQDYAAARNWYEQAAVLGFAPAMKGLGDLYRDGKGVPQKYEMARDWYEKAAALGSTTAMFNIGLLYELGQGGTKDSKQARQWYQKAADAGNELAKEKLKKFK